MRYDLMMLTRKFESEHVQCPPESKILTNIIKNHPLRFSIAASSSVPWIYMAQFWHTLKEYRSKYRLRFMLDKKELTLTLDDFRQIFHLPQANAKNYNPFVPPPSFSDMVLFYKKVLGFTMELKTQSNIKTTSLLQPWQTLCKIFSKCLTTRVTGWDQLPLQIMQVLYCFVNNIHVDYAELLWEGLYYSLPTSKNFFTSSIPYPRFTKIIVSHYMTIFPDISRRVRDMYHNLQDDDIMKNIFNTGRHKNKVGMKIPDWMITDEMKQTEHYRMYTEVFGIDVPMTQSQPTESTHGMPRTTSTSRSPNPNKEVAESSALRRSTVIRLRLPERRSTCLTPPAPVPTVDKADEMILQDTLQLSLVEHKSHEEQEARENVALVDEHLASEEVEKMKRRRDTNVYHTVNVTDEDEEITDEVYELKRREKGKNVEETRNSPIPTPIRSPRIHTNLVSSDTEKLQELTDTPHTTSSSSLPHKKLTKMNRLLSLFKTKPTRFKRYKSFFHEFTTLADNLHDVMVESLPDIVDKHVKKQVMQQVPEQVQNQVPVYVAEGLILERKKAKEETERLIAKAILQERGNIQAQISTQIENAIANVIPSQVDASVRNYMSGHILHVHPAQSQTSSVPKDIAIWLSLQMKFERYTVLQIACRTLVVRPRDQDDPHDDAHPDRENKEQAPSTSGNQEQDDDFDFWTDSYARDDDEIPTKQVSQDIMEEVSLTIDEAKLRKMAVRSRKEILVSPYPRKTTPLVHSCQKDPEAPALSLINQDLLYLKKGNSRPEKIVLSLHKFPAIIFNDDDIEERTSRWVNKCVKKFNPYARYGVEHWKNPHAKIFYIRKQKEPGKPKEEIYSNSKIVQVIKTYWELGHEHKFITEIVARRANDCIVSITEPDYKNLNKNDIEDIYLLIMNGKVPDYADTGLLWSLSVFIRSSVIWERVHDFQLGIESYHIKVLEGLKSHNNDIKYGYVQKDLTKDETEYLKLFEEEIKERLKHQRQMRRWEMYVNGRPLGLRRERPE
ncbi:hypothetical protein Tco_0452257 [Tanacetum coccineum]